MRSASLIGVLCIAVFSPRDLAGQERFDWPGFGGPGGTFASSDDQNASQLKLTKTLSVGQGRSQVVADASNFYVTALADSDTENTRTEVIVAFDRKSMTKTWTHAYETKVLDEQETFGGRVRAPQATPLLIDSADQSPVLVTLGFTGALRALDRRTGELRWETNLVEAYDSVPVQFGFASSPILVDGQLVVLAGGATSKDGGAESKVFGGLMAFSPVDGSVLWTVPCQEASYATPVIGTWGGQKQIVFVTRNRVVSVTPKGQPLWSRDLPEAGLTNVPTPIVLPCGLILSGQGMSGTEKWSIEHEGDAWNVDVDWESTEQFFYCNWIVTNGFKHLIGCTGNLLVALDTETGKTVGKWRGFADGNVQVCDDHLLVMGGKGKLHRIRIQPNGLQPLQSWQLTEGRCWTPPTHSGSLIFLRQGDRLHIAEWIEADDTLSTIIERGDSDSSKLLAWKSSKPSEPMLENSKDPLQQIISAFEQDGIDGAKTTYDSIRARNPDDLTFAMRKQLAVQAKQIGQAEFGTLLATHAHQDFQTDETMKWLVDALEVTRSDEPKERLGKNGLRYLKVGIIAFNGSIAAEVRGPAKHPFGYGFTLRPAELRRETWPIGTRVTNAESGKLLRVIKAEDAGKLLVIANGR
ncbi:MAG: PQQ-binding-like beta-propeller repeat protein [Planctomycetota bacterium]